MLIDARCMPEVAEALRPEDFYMAQNWEIFETMISMFNFSETIDPVTVANHMVQRGHEERATREYFLQLMQVTPHRRQRGRVWGIMKDKSLLRRIAETAGI